MIGPVYGKDKTQPLGIIQFINKLDMTPISELDVKKFQEMADLIGLCIENTTSITQTVGVTLKINERMRNVQKIMADEKTHNENYPTEKILEELNERFTAIKQTSDKLYQDRTREKGQTTYFEQYSMEMKKLGFN